VKKELIKDLFCLSFTEKLLLSSVLVSLASDGKGTTRGASIQNIKIEKFFREIFFMDEILNCFFIA
jgi:hypothetical protein